MSAEFSVTNWVALADRLLSIGYEIAGAAGPEIVKYRENRGDIKLVAVLLTARSLSNMRGVLAMAGDKRVVEARVLARCILENQFWTAGFSDDPEKFREAMISHDLNKRGSSGQRLFETGELSDEIEQKLRLWLRENKGWDKAKSIAPMQVARAAQIADSYVFYDLLSTDAHPTVRALNRYVVPNEGIEITDIDLDPEASAEELAETVGLACYGLVCVLMSACKILQSEFSERVDVLAHEYLEMMKSTGDIAERKG